MANRETNVPETSKSEETGKKKSVVHQVYQDLQTTSSELRTFQVFLMENLPPDLEKILATHPTPELKSLRNLLQSSLTGQTAIYRLLQAININHAEIEKLESELDTPLTELGDPEKVLLGITGLLFGMMDLLFLTAFFTAEKLPTNAEHIRWFFSTIFHALPELMASLAVGLGMFLLLYINVAGLYKFRLSYKQYQKKNVLDPSHRKKLTEARIYRQELLDKAKDTLSTQQDWLDQAQALPELFAAGNLAEFNNLSHQLAPPLFDTKQLEAAESRLESAAGSADSNETREEPQGNSVCPATLHNS